MKHMHRLGVIVCLIFSLVACQTGGEIEPSRYPMEIGWIGESPNYPLNAAGFTRAEIMSHAPGMTDISTAYRLITKEAQIAAKFHKFKKTGQARTLAKQYQAEKMQVEKNYPGAKLLAESKIVLIKKEKEYPAFKSAYEFENTFMRRKQMVYFELILTETDDRYIKFESSAPNSQKKAIAQKNMELLDAVNWTH